MCVTCVNVKKGVQEHINHYPRLLQAGSVVEGGVKGGEFNVQTSIFSN